MGHPRTGNASELLAIEQRDFSRCLSLAAFRNDRLRLIAITDDRKEFRNLPHQDIFDECSTRKGHGVLRGKRRDWISLRLISRQQAWCRGPVEHGRQFPAKVLGALNRGIRAQSLRGWHGVRGVAKKKDVTILEALGNVLFR